MPARKRIPAHKDLAEILVTEAQIKRRLATLAAEIDKTYAEQEVTAIAIINGALLFTADLLRLINRPVRLDCVRVSSYRNASVSVTEPQLRSSLTLDIENRHVLLIDDILDTGKTLAMVVGLIGAMKPASVRTCVLLDKRGRREVPFEADFVGFEVPDRFVVGYGLDFAERYRNLPCIGVLKPALQNPPEWA
ncbi:MAG TPA: hypoxanthine phosphoribosyltransferase [Opitutaceae bacterium]|nr:hypoxanthine phosphoribosyltransferase [Opitutaceae bacterium]